MAYPRFLRARQHKHILDTAGTISSLTSGTKAAIGTPPRFDIVLAAAVGDVIEAGAYFYWNSDTTGGQGFVDFATVVSSTLTNYFSGSGSGTGGVGHGISDTGAYHGTMVVIPYTLVAADISSGKVTIRWVYSSTGNKAINADTTRPISLYAKNLGPVSPH